LNSDTVLSLTVNKLCFCWMLDYMNASFQKAAAGRLGFLLASAGTVDRVLRALELEFDPFLLLFCPCCSDRQMGLLEERAASNSSSSTQEHNNGSRCRYFSFTFRLHSKKEFPLGNIDSNSSSHYELHLHNWLSFEKKGVGILFFQTFTKKKLIKVRMKKLKLVVVSDLHREFYKE
jgi:hypothetical protein